ncbi:DUF5076 domain-containing protein [Pseudoxanthomonas sangjuensis]|uniref:DUF5076 domain-containing protein n=1 Tax=Pseudoxanthomonas sangjuensis TaxID=1503750 RepID=UPI001391CE2B|nr:DUF5076 domain-containing protein [Pseudoxanthomonas sangjuensis]KAF1713487.1 DUF5076 domain-containing protein [Pseudoxanthomonas sangjuensis]
MRTLVIPPAAQRDENSIQMLSAWIAEKGLHCTLNVGMWKEQGHDEAAAWGILLADVVRHVSNAIRDMDGSDSTETALSIIESLWVEFKEPTSDASGELHPGHS